MEKFKIEPFVVNSSASDHILFDGGDFKIDSDNLTFKDKKDNLYQMSKETFVDESGNSREKDCFKINQKTYLDSNGYILASDGSLQLRDKEKFTKYEIEAHEETFKSENNGKSLTEYLSEHPNSRSIEENKQLYCHLTEIKQAAENDENFSPKTKISFSNEKNEMFLGIEMNINGRESPFRFIVRDGQVALPDDASPAELKEMVAFLNARGIRGFDLPKALQEIQNDVDQKPLPSESLKKEKDVDNVPAASQSEPEPETKKEPQTKIDFKDIEKNMRSWCDRNGKRENLSYFENGGGLFSSWSTWTIFPGENRDNMDNLGKKDKDGNRKSLFEAQISARIKNGKLEVKYCLPAGGKMNPNVAEQIVELHAMNGAKKIRFKGTHDHNLKEIRLACAKKLIVPVGIGLKVSAAKEMITEARKTHDIGNKILDYEKRLAEQIRDNAVNKGKDMTETEAEFYKDTMKKVSVAKYETLFSEPGGINEHLVKMDKAGTDVTKVMGSRYAAADVFLVYLKVVGSENPTVGEIEKKLYEVNDKLGMSSISSAQYKDFLNETKLTGKEKITDISPEQMTALYVAILESREKLAYKNVEKAYMGKGNSTERQVSDRALASADNYFKTNFTGQYSGIMDKAYPVIPSTHDGLEFEIPQKIKDDAQEKARNSKNQRNEEANSGRKNEFNKRVDALNSQSNNNEKQGKDNTKGKIDQTFINARNVKQH